MHMNIGRALTQRSQIRMAQEEDKSDTLPPSNDNDPGSVQAGDLDKKDIKTSDKVKLMASQVKTKTKENAKKIAEKTRDRLSIEGQLRQARISLERYVNPKLMNRPLTEDTLIPKWVLKFSLLNLLFKVLPFFCFFWVFTMMCKDNE